jgi:predicted nucleic acid-binding protein
MHAEPTSGLIIAEPRAAYAARRPLVVDCSVLVAMVFNEPARDSATRLLAGHELFAPHLLDHEMVHVAVKKAADGRREDALFALTEFAVVPIARRHVDTTAQWRTAVQYDLSGYDAAYLQLALDLGAPLATFDQRLGETARRALSG